MSTLLLTVQQWLGCLSVKKPQMAYKINVVGTNNLVDELINFNRKSKKDIKLIHISTDGVYESTRGIIPRKVTQTLIIFTELLNFCQNKLLKNLRNILL